MHSNNRFLYIIKGFNSPGNFLVRNEALVIIDFSIVAVEVEDVTLIPSEPSADLSRNINKEVYSRSHKFYVNSKSLLSVPVGPELLELRMAFVASITSG